MSFMCHHFLLQDDGQQLKEETPQDAKDKVAKGIVSTCHNV